MSVALRDLQGIELLAQIPATELEWFAAQCEERCFAAGDVLFARDVEARELFLLLEGTVDLRRREGGQEVASFALQAGETAGRLPFSRMTHYPAEFVAQTACRIAVLPFDRFAALHTHAPVAEERLVHQMIDRTRDVTRFDVSREKLASLGTMAAGLAHELNNPASAARRTAQDLAKTLQAFDEHSSNIVRQFIFEDPPDEPPSDPANDPFDPVYTQMTLESPARDALEQSDLEAELEDWLAEQGLAEPWLVAPTLVAGGFTQPFLAEFARRLVPDQVTNFLEWVSKDVEMRLLARELLESTKRIAELVAAMKSYSYMDQGVSKSEVDVHEGIDNTLRVLRHKLVAQNVQVVRRFDASLPRILAYGSELNQVWTNLIDNALAAVDDAGTLTLISGWDRAAGMVCIDIVDDGNGIPDAIQDRIFEPFFTTRGVGEGTGLGLDITNRIVTRHHQGTIQVTSEPGQTRFRVRLPVKEQPVAE